MKISNYIKKNFHFFIIIPVLLSGLLYWGAKIKVAPKKHEKIQMFISCVDLNNKALEKAIKDTNKVDVKEINVSFAIYGSSSMNMVYSTVYSEMDVLVLPKTFLDENIEHYYPYYTKLDESVISSYVGDVDYYTYGENKYALKIYDSATKSGWCDSIIKYEKDGFNEDYYMFFVFKSVNLGELSKSKSNHALEFMKAMKEYEK